MPVRQVKMVASMNSMNWGSALIRRRPEDAKEMRTADGRGQSRDLIYSRPNGWTRSAGAVHSSYTRPMNVGQHSTKGAYR